MPERMRAWLVEDSPKLFIHAKKSCICLGVISLGRMPCVSVNCLSLVRTLRYASTVMANNARSNWRKFLKSPIADCQFIVTCPNKKTSGVWANLDKVAFIYNYNRSIKKQLCRSLRLPLRDNFY